MRCATILLGLLPSLMAVAAPCMAQPRVPTYEAACKRTWDLQVADRRVKVDETRAVFMARCVKSYEPFSAADWAKLGPCLVDAKSIPEAKACGKLVGNGTRPANAAAKSPEDPPKEKYTRPGMELACTYAAGLTEIELGGKMEEKKKEGIIRRCVDAIDALPDADHQRDALLCLLSSKTFKDTLKCYDKM